MVKKPKVDVAHKPELQTESTGLSLKKESVIRRSGRIRNLNPPSQNREIEPVVEIDVIEGDMAYEPNAEEVPAPSERSLEEKMDYVLQAVEELKSKASRRYPQDDIPVTDLSYKNLYFDSQRKIESLTKENYELSKEAEVALAKLEAYGEATRVWSEVLGQVKDVFRASNPPKATRRVKNLSSLTNAADLSSPPKEIAGANGAVETQSRVTKKKKAR